VAVIMADDLHYLTLREIGALIRTSAASSIEVTMKLLERIRAVDPKLNSYLCLTEENALAQANTADAQIRSGRVRGPLHGVPLAVKDICDMSGVATTAGMSIHLGSRAAQDATVIRRLKEAGAVILGKLNLTEGVYAEHVQPFGSPVNPWNSDRWPGASSSGCGVATAAGLCYGAIGSDTGGSIRLPSAANGVTGLKPTWGRVSRHGIFELAATLDHVGPMARSAADAGILLGVIAGPDPADPTAAFEPVPDYLAELEGGLGDLCIGIDRRWVSDDVDGATVNALHMAVEVLRDLGGVVVDTVFPDPTQIVLDWFTACAVQTAVAHEATYPARKSEYGPALSALLELGRELSGIEYQRVILRRNEFRGRVQGLFQYIDMLAIPVLACPTPTIERMKTVDDKMISNLHRFTCPFTMSGNPTITIPNGFGGDGMPIAMQLVGRYFDEAALLRAAHAFQQATQWHCRHPEV
jgi:amidase